MVDSTEYIQKRLFELQDLKYRDFHARLMPTVDKNLIIGVRVPLLRKLAKELYSSEIAESFLEKLPHKYYEENNIHAFLTEQIKDYDECVSALEKFLPYVDNWATCDMMRPKAFKKNTDKLLVKIKEWINSEKPYTIRFGIEMLMIYYLDELYDNSYPKLVLSVTHSDYYVKMMVAWYFATALSKQYEEILPFIEEGIPDIWTHNKAIQKATESYRITKEQKDYLRTLKR